MPEYGWLSLYCALILVASMFGGYLPLVGKITHSKLQFYLSASAGVMLGASFFHVMPDAMENSGAFFGWWMSLGAVGLFCIERFVAPHSHEMDGGHQHHHHEHNQSESSEHQHDHDPRLSNSGEKRAAAPAVAGWAAVFGLTLHTFMNGVGLGSAVKAGAEASTAWMAMPGLALFFAIVLHKPADALAISTVLSRKGISRQKIFLVLLGFAAMVPVGAIAFYLIGEHLEEDAQKQLIGAALAFSAGTFLFVALSDLLPEVQFHRHDRGLLFLSLLGGLALMGFIAWLEPREERIKIEPEEAEMRQIESAARRAGLKVPKWALDRLKAAAAKEVEQEQQSH